MHRPGLLPAVLVACLATHAGAQPPPSGSQVAGPLAAWSSPHGVPVTTGRRINLVCMGQGSPTVILSAGAAAWSISWYKVQPAVARTTRVCSWDRAGNGFSDASPEPQDIVHIEADLEQALQAGGVTGPLVLVGHSQGGLESLLFADRNPGRTKGLVLVDPANPDQQERLHRAAPNLMAYSDRSDLKGFASVRQCVDALKAKPQGDTPPPCAAQRAGYPKPIREALSAWTRDPAYWRTYLSDFEQRDRNAKLAINPRRNYGTTPMVVLGSGVLAIPGAPPDVLKEIPAVQAEIERGHRDLAALSSRASYVRVPDSGHAIMLQKPGVVIEAIERVVAEARNAAP